MDHVPGPFTFRSSPELELTPTCKRIARSASDGDIDLSRMLMQGLSIEETWPGRFSVETRGKRRCFEGNTVFEKYELSVKCERNAKSQSATNGR